MDINAVQGLIKIAQVSTTLELPTQELLLSWILIAQEYRDIFTYFQNSFNNFVESGQVWALLIGFVLGYLFRNLTAY